MFGSNLSESFKSNASYFVICIVTRVYIYIYILFSVFAGRLIWMHRNPISTCNHRKYPPHSHVSLHLILLFISFSLSLSLSLSLSFCIYILLWREAVVKDKQFIAEKNMKYNTYMYELWYLCFGKFLFSFIFIFLRSTFNLKLCQKEKKINWRLLISFSDFSIQILLSQQALSDTVWK